MPEQSFRTKTSAVGQGYDQVTGSCTTALAKVGEGATPATRAQNLGRNFSFGLNLKAQHLPQPQDAAVNTLWRWSKRSALMLLGLAALVAYGLLRASLAELDGQSTLA